MNNTNAPQKKKRLRTVNRNILLEGLNLFHDANLTLSSDVDQETYIFNKKVKEMSDNHATEEHQSKQLFNFLFVCLDTCHRLKNMFL